MASRTTTYNYPDGAGPRIVAALKDYYNVPTAAEAFSAYDQECKDRLKAIVVTYERRIAAKAA